MRAVLETSLRSGDQTDGVGRDPFFDGAAGSAALEELILQDRARLLYAKAAGSFAATALCTASLVVIAWRPANWIGLLCWLGVMAAILVWRIVDLLAWRATCDRTDWPGQAAIRRFGYGAILSGLAWASFPPLFFSTVNDAGRIGMVAVLVAMTGGVPAVLSASAKLAIGFCLCLLLPFSFMYFLRTGGDGAFFGVLGAVESAVMSVIILVSCRAASVAIRTARINQILTKQAVAQEARTNAANAMLQATQVALHEINDSLESRIKARTSDLQHQVTERKSYARALARLASNDSLTGLFNRATFSERLAVILDDALQSGDVVALLFLDLDGFKQVNDAHGHGAGDHVLRVVAERLSGHGNHIHVARWGGDEFVMAISCHPEDGCAPMHDEAGALAFARMLRATLISPIEIGPRSVGVGVTIGIALYPEHAASQDGLIRAADLAMYAGKREPGVEIRMFDHKLALVVSDRQLLEQSLRDAIADHALSVHYQPIINSATGHCDVMEALLRWTHSDRGVIEPSLFIPLAEELGLITSIGRFVLLNACHAAKLWPGPNPPAVSVNISIAQITSGHLLRDVQAALKASGLHVSRLQLEITESMFAADHARITPILEELRALGIHMALDDFGTGFSSLARLKTLPIDTIKIDKAFVQDCSAESLAIIQAILLIARAMHLDVTAEGVESEQQRVMLTDLGTTRLQGFLLSRPIPADAVAAWLLSCPLNCPAAHRAAVG